MKPVMKEGWLVLNIVYSDGSEGWRFEEDEPIAALEVYRATVPPSWVEGQVKRILYCEVEAPT